MLKRRQRRPTRITEMSLGSTGLSPFCHQGAGRCLWHMNFLNSIQPMMRRWVAWPIIISSILSVNSCSWQKPAMEKAVPLPVELMDVPVPEMPPPPPPKRLALMGVKQKIIGMSRNDILARYGPPAEESDAAPAKIIRYANRVCRAAFYLYFDLQRGEFVVLHYDVNDQPAPAPREELCLRSLGAHANLH